MPEFVVANAFEAGKYQQPKRSVWGWARGRLIPSARITKALRDHLARLHPRIVQGDVPLAKGLVRLDPRDKAVRLALVKALLLASGSGKVDQDELANHLAWYRLVATKDEWAGLKQQLIRARLDPEQLDGDPLPAPGVDGHVGMEVQRVMLP